jgi:hypothetical protein
LLRVCEQVYDDGVFEELGTAIDELTIPTDGAALAAVLALRDRLDARISDAVADYDRAGLWELDGATSTTAWLTHHTRMPRARASATTARARKVAQLPVTAAAWRDGLLSSGQIDAIATNLDPDTVALFAHHEAGLVPRLVDLSVRDVAAAMAAWRECATADRPPKPEPAQTLHLSRTLGGRWRLDANLGPEGGELLATALRLAQSPDSDSDAARSAATRRADALTDICRHFLDHQHTRREGRHRPHLNLVLDLDRYQALAGAGARSVDGTRLDRTTVERLLCDAALHRVLTQGRSAILDYGTATRTIPAPLFNALVVRDQRCRFPGCDRPAHWCEGHHVRPWVYGGPTQLLNLALLCSRHHHLLHTPGWHAKLLPDNTLEVTDPQGRIHTSHPPGPDRAPPLPLLE